MGTLANRPTRKSVNKFIDAVKNKKRKEDAKVLLEIMKEITGEEPKVWGVSIIAFGQYKYQRKNGEEYDWFNVGFSPGSKHMSVYVMFDLEKEKKLLEKLGPHSHGRGCLYIKDLNEVDMKVLRKIIEKSDRWNR